MGWLSGILLKLVWTIVIKGPLQLISAFDHVFHYLTAGIFYDALFGGKKFDINQLPFAFWAFWIVALFVVVLIFVIQFFTLMYQENSTIKQRLIRAGSNTIRAGLWTIIMPVAFFIGVTLIEFTQQVIQDTFGGSNTNLASMLYYVGNTSLDPTVSLPSAPSDFSAPNDIGNWNFLAEIIGVYVTAWALCLAGLACAGKVFEMYILFIIGPLFGASMVADDGVRLKTWRDAVTGKMFVSAGTILTYSVYASLLPMLFHYASGNSTNFNSFETILFKILVLIGGGVFLETMPPFFANFVGESAGKAEGRHAMNVGRVGASMARAGLVGVASAIGVGKTARAKQGSTPSKYGKFASAAANAGQSAGEHKNMTGALGLVGKGIRFGSSLVGGITAAGFAMGLGGKRRAKTQRDANKEHIKNVFNRRKNEFMDNVNHGKRHHTDVQKRRNAFMKNSYDKSKTDPDVFLQKNDKLKKEILSRAKNDNWKYKKSGSFEHKTKNDWTK